MYGADIPFGCFTIFISGLIESMAEMENLNVCEGFKLYKRIQKVSQERREYKNKIKLIQALEHASMKDLISGNLLMQAKDIDDQLYKPRILKEEFKGKKWCK